MGRTQTWEYIHAVLQDMLTEGWLPQSLSAAQISARIP